MKDDGESSILKAIKAVHDDREDIFSYGITDTTKIITLYNPHTKRGVRVAGKGGAHVLPPPFNKEHRSPALPSTTNLSSWISGARSRSFIAAQASRL